MRSGQARHGVVYVRRDRLTGAPMTHDTAAYGLSSVAPVVIVGGDSSLGQPRRSQRCC
jgi:hypothetical protein